MPRICAVTGKKGNFGNNRSHSNVASKRKWGANLQKVRIILDGKVQRVYISARALKTGKFKRA
jgi:large subunit ribosomal protein L28